MSEIILPPNDKEIIQHNEDMLSRVVHKALEQLEAILDAPLPQGEDRMKMMSIKKDAATSMVNAGLKADENRFRRENKDIIERLFDKIKKESRMIEGKVIHKV